MSLQPAAVHDLMWVQNTPGVFSLPCNKPSLYPAFTFLSITLCGNTAPNIKELHWLHQWTTTCPNKYKSAFCLWICSSISQSADVRGEWVAARKGEGGGDGVMRGRGKVWQSLTVGTKDPGCFGAHGERGRESEAEVEWVSVYRKAAKEPDILFFLWILPLGGKENRKVRSVEKRQKKKDMKRTWKKEIVIKRTTKFSLSLSSSISHLSQFNLKSTPISPEGLNSLFSCKYSLSFTCFHSLSVFSAFLCLSALLWNNAGSRQGFSINCLLFDCIHEWVAFVWTLHIINKWGVCIYGIGNRNGALWWFSMHNLSYSEVRVCGFVCVCLSIPFKHASFGCSVAGQFKSILLIGCVCALMQLM